MKMFVMRFRIWFRYLLIVLVVMLGIELCLFMPKEQVVREIETVDEQTGGLVTVDLDTRQITVYRRGLILPRYFPQERLQMKPDKEIKTSFQNWYTLYIVKVDAKGQIRIADMRRSFGWLWYPLTFSYFLSYSAQRKAIDEES